MKKSRIITIAIIGTAVCLLPGLIFLIKFHSYPLSDNPQDWGSFGDYIGGVLSPMLALIGIFTATYVTIVANRIQTQQVRPVANIVIGNYVDDLYVDLRNGGLGPLIVKSLKVKSDKGDERVNVIDHMPKLNSPKCWANYVSKIEGRVISPSGKINLIRFKTDINNAYDVTMKYQIKQALSSLTIEVEYTDIFENLQPVVTRTLDSFSKYVPNSISIGQEENDDTGK